MLSNIHLVLLFHFIVFDTSLSIPLCIFHFSPKPAHHFLIKITEIVLRFTSLTSCYLPWINYRKTCWLIDVACQKRRQLYPLHLTKRSRRQSDRNSLRQLWDKMDHGKVCNLVTTKQGLERHLLLKYKSYIQLNSSGKVKIK